MSTEKTPVSHQTLTQHLYDQIRFLRKSCRDFDEGDEAEFSRIAVILRILFYKNGSSIPLIEQAGAVELEIPSYSEEIDPKELLGVYPLAVYKLANGTMRFVARLGDTNATFKTLPYKQWWDEEVLRGQDRRIFSRRDLVLHVANQDGGAHVDPALDKKYHDLKNTGAVGVVFTGSDGVRRPVMDLEKAYMRHIAFEFLSVVKLEALT